MTSAKLTIAVALICFTSGSARAQPSVAARVKQSSAPSTPKPLRGAYPAYNRARAGHPLFTLVLSEAEHRDGVMETRAAWVRVPAGNTLPTIIVLRDETASPELVQMAVLSAAWATSQPVQSGGRHSLKPFDLFIPARSEYPALDNTGRAKVAAIISELRAAAPRDVAGFGRFRAISVPFDRFL